MDWAAEINHEMAAGLPSRFEVLILQAVLFLHLSESPSYVSGCEGVRCCALTWYHDEMK